MSMLLRFQVIPTLKGSTRFSVWRTADTPGAKDEYLGSFTGHKRREAIIEQLSDAELLEFDNFCASLDFVSENFGPRSEPPLRTTLRLPNEVLAALPGIYSKSKMLNLPFQPTTQFLDTLISQAHSADQFVALLFNESCKMPTDTKGHDLQTPSHIHCNGEHILFVTLLDHFDNTDDVAELLNQAARKYGKKGRIKAHFLPEYASPNPKIQLTKWWFSIAIDVLVEAGELPTEEIPTDTLTTHWLRLHESDSFSKTIRLFDKKFSDITQPEPYHLLIKKHFLRKELISMGGLKGFPLLPNAKASISHWVKAWQEGHKSPSLQQCIKDFSSRYPISAESDFCTQYITEIFSKE